VIRARLIACESTSTRISTTSTPRGTSGSTQPRLSGWRQTGRRAARAIVTRTLSYRGAATASART
jgi:hypothetical protein